MFDFLTEEEKKKNIAIAVKICIGIVIAFTLYSMWYNWF